MTVRRYRLGGMRELRVAQTRGLVFLAIHDADRCISGPLAVPVGAALDTLRSALGDVLGEHGSGEATDVEDAATRERRSEKRCPGSEGDPLLAPGEDAASP